VISLREKFGYLFSQIGNADQTPIWFYMLELTTAEHAGEWPLQVRIREQISTDAL
jgi:hypothetical protein